jgi:hypothetical protein
MTEPFGTALKSCQQAPICLLNEPFGQWRKLMKMINIALLAGLSVAALASPAMAAVKNSQGAATGRDAAIAACSSEARQRFGGMYYNFDQNRSYVYGDCMQEHGQPR